MGGETQFGDMGMGQGSGVIERFVLLIQMGHGAARFGAGCCVAGWHVIMSFSLLE